MEVPHFEPQSGVRIETDPKAAAGPVSSGDDEAVVARLADELRVITYSPKDLNYAYCGLLVHCLLQRS